MNLDRSRTSARIVMAGLASTLAMSTGLNGGCLRDRHLLGQDWLDGGVASQPGTGGAAGAGALSGSDAGAELRPVEGPGLPSSSDAGPPTTVVPLGSEGGLGWPVAIPAAEIARRLSQFVLRKPASAALIAAVVAGAPATNQDVGRLTDGLLLDETSLAGREAFYRWWLSLDDFLTAERDPALFPLLTADVRSALIAQTLQFAEDVTWRPRGSLSTLLAEPTAFVTAATAPWFPGVVVPVGALATRVALDGSHYAGIIGQPAVVATADYPYRISPSRRGMGVRTRYLCDSVPPPPANVPPLEFHGELGITIRQMLEAHRTNPACAACHNLIDPLGMAFGHFDAVGAYHQTEGSLPIDSSGILIVPYSGEALAFDGASGLASQLARLSQVRTCFATKWLAFATGKYPDSGSVSSGGDLSADADYVVRRATIQGELNLRGTIRAVTETHSFLDP